MMAGIPNGNTAPEKIVRSLLHGRGFRFRLRDSNLPGKPDIVLAKYQAVIFVHGCFWHCHQCGNFKWPKTNADFWREKLLANARRDANNIDLLIAAKWRVLVVWECALRGYKSDPKQVSKKLAHWLQGNRKKGEITG
jgi:DNA mismatch endonuclease, patch repair protein